MLEAGLVEEVRALLARGVAPRAAGMDAVGYREVVAMLEGRLALPDLADAIIVATRQYAKRQETWFRHQLRRDAGGLWEAPWTLDATERPEVLAGMIAERWHAQARHPTPHTPHPTPHIPHPVA
jgi:tRNA A37 N6-isopentenylltransferase MiaA